MDAAIKDRPILFNGPMVRAILEGRKSQTRRVAKPIKHPDWGNLYTPGALIIEKESDDVIKRSCPYGSSGDRLWVRETFIGPLFPSDLPEDHLSSKYLTPEYCHYKASGDSCEYVDMDDNIAQKWTPSIHMPRWASRILLEITNIRIERLDNISEDDAVAEGAARTDELNGCADDIDSARHAYKLIWESINGKGSWDTNPFVWVIGFKVVNIRGDQT